MNVPISSNQMPSSEKLSMVLSETVSKNNLTGDEGQLLDALKLSLFQRTSRLINSSQGIFHTEAVGKKLALFCDSLLQGLNSDFGCVTLLNEDSSIVKSHISFSQDLSGEERVLHKTKFIEHLQTPASQRNSLYAGILAQNDNPSISKGGSILLSSSFIAEILKSERISLQSLPVTFNRIISVRESNGDFFQTYIEYFRSENPLYVFTPLTNIDGSLFGFVIYRTPTNSKTNLKSYTDQDLQLFINSVHAFIKQIGSHLEQDRLYRQAIEDNLRIQATQVFAQELISSERFINGNAEKKMKHFCETLTNQNFAAIASLIVLDDNGVIRQRSISVRKPNSPFLPFYNDRFAQGKNIDLSFFTASSLSARKVSSAYVVKEKDLRRETVSVQSDLKREIIFLPIFESESKLTGILSALMETDLTSESAVQLLELYVRIAGKELTSVQQTEVVEAANELIDLEFKTEEDALRFALSKVISFFKSANAVFFYSTDFQSIDLSIFSGSDEDRKRMNLIPKYELEVAASFSGFQVEKSICFSIEQQTRLLLALEEGMNPPIDLRSAGNAEANLIEFSKDNEFYRLLIPLKIQNDLLGYIEVSHPRSTEISVVRLALQTLSPILKEASLRLQTFRLTRDLEKLNSKHVILKDLLGSLIEVNKGLRKAGNLQEKLTHVTESITMTFGFKFCSIAIWNEENLIRESAFTFHPESEVHPQTENIEKSFKVGSKVPVNAIKSIISPLLEFGYAFVVSKKEIEQASSVLKPQDDQLNQNLNRYFSGDPDIELYIPLYSEDQTFMGYMRLGGLMILNEIDRASFLERLKLISLFAKQLSQEIDLIESLKIRASEISEKSRLSKTLATLFEVGTAISQTGSMNDKLRLLCEALSVSTGIHFAIACLYDELGKIEFSQYYADTTFKWKLKGLLEEHFSPGKTINTAVYQTLFQTPRFKVGQLNVYCADVRVLSAILNKTDLTVFGSENISKSQVFPTQETTDSGSDYLERYFENRGTPEEDRYILAIPFTFDSNSPSKVVGFLTLGSFSDIESVPDLYSRLSAIDLFVSIVNADLKNFLLNRFLVRSEAQFRNIVENIQLGFLITRHDGKIDYANPSLKSTLGWGDIDLKGKLLEEFVHGSSFDETVLHREKVYRGETVSSEVLLKAQNGEFIPMELKTSPQFIISDTGELSVIGAFSVLRDRRKEKELELQEKEMETIKNNFYAMVVHDMKVPLSAIYGYSEMLKDSNPSDIPIERFKSMMEQMFLSSTNITRLVQEILEFSKYESRKTKLEYQKQNFQLCIDLVVEQLQYDIHNKGILVKRSVEGTEDWIFYFDFDRIVRVVSNLLGNAVKFSKSNSIIEINLRKLEKFGREYALVTIKDSGEGIAPDEVDLIFDAYRQANSKHGSRGTGLGLSIAKQIITLHNGEITAESYLGKGTIISFTLPMLQVNPN
ncbi:MAG: PAS domain-containing sensor histidine kinase [Chloroherpetonaceae bacterium]|nr:PAS domain-containing sensor histidine kinase [Chloroherpetonaceae bacterium]